MKRVVYFLLMAVISLPLAFSCNRGLEVPDPEASLAPFPKPSEQIDRIPLTRTEEGFVQAGNEFAWRLTRKIWEANPDRKGIILSPLSVQYALGMVGNGADAKVAAQVAKVLGYEGTDAINAFCSKMIECLPAVDTTVTLALANGVLVNDEYELKAPFKTTLEDYYDALVESMSFSDPNAVMKYVNDWCFKHTYGRITDVLKKVHPLASLYLMNAIYFNAPWASPFNKEESRDENFQTLSGGSIKVRMMHKTLERAGYWENDIAEKISLPYGNGRYIMTIILPKKKDGLDALLANPERKMNPESCKIILSLPNFYTEYDTDLLGLLGEMGLPDAPYIEMATKDGNTAALGISQVRHKANITVNEAGSEAAAVTVVEMFYLGANLSAQQPRTVYFTADHPFLYTISEITSGAILFTGIYTGE